MAIEHPPKLDLRAVAADRVDILLRRYGHGGDYDNVIDDRATDTLDRAVEELRSLRNQLADATEPSQLVAISNRIVALRNEVELAVDKSARATIPSAAETLSVEDQPTEPNTPDERPESADENRERETLERGQLFDEAARLTAQLPDVGSIKPTSPLTKRLRALLNDVDRLWRLVSALDHDIAPLNQLNRRVTDLRQSRALLDVYVDIAEVMDGVTEKRRMLLPDDPQRKLADTLLRLPDTNTLTPQQELDAMSQRLEELRQVNIAMALPNRTSGRYLLNRDDIIQDAITLPANMVEQEVAVRGTRSGESKVQEVPLTTQVHRLLAVVFAHIHLLPHDRIRRQALEVANEARALLTAIDQSDNRMQAQAEHEQQLREYQNRLTSLDRQLMAVMASSAADVEEAPTDTMSQTDRVRTATNAMAQSDVAAAEVPMAGSLIDQGGWSQGRAEPVEVPIAHTPIVAPQPEPTPSPKSALPTLPELVSTPLEQRRRLHVVEPSPITARDSDLAMYRTKYRNLLRQRQELEQKIAAKGVLAAITRGSNRADEQRLDDVLARFRQAHPEVTNVRLDDLNEPLARAEEVNYLQRSTSGRHTTLGVRKAAGEKIVAIQKAEAQQVFDLDAQRSAALRAERYDERRRIPLKDAQPRQKVITTLNQLLNNPPGIFQSHADWFSRLAEPERELVARTFHGEAATAIQYWQHKLEVLHEIRPTIFGRQRWQQEYDQTQANLHEAQQEAHRWMEQRTAENRARLAA